MGMKRAKEQVEAVVKEYIKLFPAEYKNFLNATAAKVDNLGIDNDFAEVKGSDMVVRHLFDLPETLHFALQRGLTQEEYDWLYSRGAYEKSKNPGLLWFMNRFPMFSITKEF